jgi:chaperonin GroEL
MLQPDARVALKKGVDIMADLIRVTMGPRARYVGMERLYRSGDTPELLDDGATIARRMVELPNRFENMGAMLIRHLTWRVGEEAGDGTTTAAVIAQSALHVATRYIAAGGNPMTLKRGMEKALDVALDALRAQAKPLDCQEDYSRVAFVASGDDLVGAIFAEIYKRLGREAVVLVEDSARTNVSWTHVDGINWDKGFLSPGFITDEARQRADLENPLLLITDRNIDKASELVPLLDRMVQSGHKHLFIMANEISAEAVGLLVANQQKDLVHAIAVNAPGYGDRRVGITEDMAIMTGARYVSEIFADKIEDVTIYDLGRAKRATANRNEFTVVSGAGNKEAIRRRADNLEKALPKIDNEFDREKTRERMGKLRGGVAVIYVGAPTEAQQKQKRLKIEDAIAAVRAAAEEGITAGGGAAYLACSTAVKNLTLSGDEAVGRDILLHALEAPARRIAINGGFNPDVVLDNLERLPAGHGFDVMAETYVNMIEAGIIDAAKVARMALEKGVSGAIMAFTTEALVRSRRDDPALNP